MIFFVILCAVYDLFKQTNFMLEKNCLNLFFSSKPLINLQLAAGDNEEIMYKPVSCLKKLFSD